MITFEKTDWAVDIVNEVYTQFAHSPLAGMPVAVEALKEQGITERGQISQILMKSQFVHVPELNLANAMALF